MPQCTITGIPVSILVLVDFLFGQNDTFGVGLELFVSILVLVDFLFGQAEILKAYPTKKSCFNPCFGGFSFRTLKQMSAMNVMGFSFNPCFGGFSFRTRPTIYLKELLKQFQSLFWWIFFSDETCTRCFMETNGFQSLFWWIFFSDHQAPKQSATFR